MLQGHRQSIFRFNSMFETMILFANIRLGFQLQCISNSTCTAKQRYHKRSAKIIIEMKMIEFKPKKYFNRSWLGHCFPGSFHECETHGLLASHLHAARCRISSSRPLYIPPKDYLCRLSAYNVYLTFGKIDLAVSAIALWMSEPFSSIAPSWREKRVVNRRHWEKQLLNVHGKSMGMVLVLGCFPSLTLKILCDHSRLLPTAW